MEPARFDEMRPGCFDIEARDPRHGPGRHLGLPVLPVARVGLLRRRLLAGEGQGPRAGLPARLQRLAPGGVGRDATPSASSRCSCPGWPTSTIAAAEVRANAARGFKAVSFPEFPAQLQLPSIFSGALGPLLRRLRGDRHGRVPAHRRVGWAPLPSPDPPFELLPTVFPVNALLAAGEWLWSGVPLRFPGLQVAMSEGGIGWVPMLMDRADYVLGALGVGNREHGLAVRPAAERGAPAQLLVLLHRRPVRRRAAPRDRPRPHHGGERLPARRLVVARHPARAGRELGRAPRRRAAGGGRRQRQPASSATRSRRSTTGAPPAP